MHTNTKRSSAVLVLAIVVLLAVIWSRFFSSPFQVSTRALLLLTCFLPFPWFMVHFFLWLKHHSHVDEQAILHGQTPALEQERTVHRSQVIASIGGLYFLILAASWVFTNAL
jgi:Ca2+/Na+ antiporter